MWRKMLPSSTSNSRAHTIVAINFSQKGENAAGQNTTMTSIIYLVDLAGRYKFFDIPAPCILVDWGVKLQFSHIPPLLHENYSLIYNGMEKET